MSAFEKSQGLFGVVKGTEKILYPLIEWVLYFAVFFVRNIFHFLQSPDVQEVSLVNTHYMQTFFIYNAPHFSGLYPCVSKIHLNILFTIIILGNIF